MLPDELQRMKAASTKAYFDMLVSELSNRIEIPLGFDFSTLHSLCKSFIKKNSIFGANLTFEGICQMNQLIDHICRQENIIIEGLFRKSGSKVRQNELIEHLAHGNLGIDLTKSSYSIHDICCVLKRFIFELPHPLLTDTLRDLFFETLKIQSFTNQIDTIRILILLLPESNQTFIKDLFRLFDEIIKFSSHNLMTSGNLSTIFSPMFFFTSDTSAEQLKDSLQDITQCLKLMIDNSNKIFFPPDSILTSAKMFLEKWNSSNKLMSTTSLIPHAKMCVTTVSNEPSDYTKQQMALLFAELQKTVNDKKSKKNKKFSEKRQKELLCQATNQSVFGTPLVKLERDKRQQELIKQQMSSKKHNNHALKDFGSAIRKKFHCAPKKSQNLLDVDFRQKKYQIQGSAAFIAKKRRSMEFQQTFITPKNENHSENVPKNPISNSRLLDFSSSSKIPVSKQISNSKIDSPPPLPPKPTPRPVTKALPPRRSSLNFETKILANKNTISTKSVRDIGKA